MNCRFVDILLQVRIIRSDKCIPEIPSMIRKNIIRCRKTKCSQILDEKHRCCSRISLSKNMDLPQS